jgi:hypothetical protein
MSINTSMEEYNLSVLLCSLVFLLHFEHLRDDNKVSDDDAEYSDDEGTMDAGQAAHGQHDGRPAEAGQQGLHSRFSSVEQWT